MLLHLLFARMQHLSQKCFQAQCKDSQTFWIIIACREAARIKFATFSYRLWSFVWIVCYDRWCIRSAEQSSARRYGGLRHASSWALSAYPLGGQLIARGRPRCCWRLPGKQYHDVLCYVSDLLSSRWFFCFCRWCSWNGAITAVNAERGLVL